MQQRPSKRRAKAVAPQVLLLLWSIAVVLQGLGPGLRAEAARSQGKVAYADLLRQRQRPRRVCKVLYGQQLTYIATKGASVCRDNSSVLWGQGQEKTYAKLKVCRTQQGALLLLHVQHADNAALLLGYKLQSCLSILQRTCKPRHVAGDLRARCRRNCWLAVAGIYHCCHQALTLLPLA
jgi:hypothetical protein